MKRWPVLQSTATNSRAWTSVPGCRGITHSGAMAVHALGYVAAISEQDLKRIDSAAYAGTTLIGKLGVEGAYENELHGTPGIP